ncbi:MAG: BioY family transporter [Dictyoglomus sp. NZ13-RE01]|nr:MAG: BioY family transporter [Dictyoglomus sp. NZ13-RE01]
MRTKKITFFAISISLMIIGSYLSLPLPFTNVPFTLQVFFLFLISMLFKPWESFLIILGYLLLGAIGFPVFAGGRGGISVLFGATGGYLWGFLISSPVISIFTNKGKEIYKLFWIILGLLIIYLLGSIWLMFFLKISYKKALILGVLPFLPLDILKGILALLVSKYLDRFRKESLL